MMQKAYIIRNPIYDYAFDFMRLLESDYQLLPILWFTDPSIYFHQVYRLPYADRWHDRIYFAPESELAALLDQLDKSFTICLALPWEEAAVETAATIMERYQLPGPDPHLMRLFRDKYRLKQHLLQHDPGLPLHRFFELRGFDDFKAKRSELPQRFVVKPVDGVGNCANGFFSQETPESTLQDFFGSNPFQRFIVEEFLQGQEYAVNGQIDAEGRVQILSIVEYERKAANGRPNLYFRDWLVHEDEAAFPLLHAYAERVMKASGLKSSPFHMELMLVGQQPYLIEVGARFVGAHLIYATDRAHAPKLNSFRLALHYYLPEDRPLLDAPNWPHYNATQHTIVTGIVSKTEPLMALHGVAEVEAMPEFFLWFRKQRVGEMLRTTVDGETTPYVVQIISQNSPKRLLAQSEYILKTLRWNEISPWRRLGFYLWWPWHKLRYKLYFLGLKVRFAQRTGRWPRMSVGPKA